MRIKAFGKAMTWLLKFKLRPRTGLILWVSTKVTNELTNYFKIDTFIDTTLH